MVCARLNFFKIFIFIFSPRRSRRGTLGISSPGGPVEEPLKPFCSFFFSLSSFVVRRVSMGILETDTWPEQDHKRESTLAQTFDLYVSHTYLYICPMYMASLSRERSPILFSQIVQDKCHCIMQWLKAICTWSTSCWAGFYPLFSLRFPRPETWKTTVRLTFYCFHGHFY